MSVIPDALEALVACIDERNGLFGALKTVEDVRGYLAAPGDGADEETLTEPILREVLRHVLGFPPDAIFEQLSRDGSKPDFTPLDLVAHSFVLDAKSTTTGLAPHEPQIRAYIRERALAFGVLFNLREVRVYRAEGKGHDPDLSFAILPLWEFARGDLLGEPPEVERFRRFCAQFAHRRMGLAEMIGEIRNRETWSSPTRNAESAVIDVDYLVERLRRLSLRLQDDAGLLAQGLEGSYALTDARERRILGELRMLAVDLQPKVDIDTLPATLAAWRHESELSRRVWRQYLLRVAYLALARILLYRSWEDVGFVDEYLFDGGFGRWYDHYDRDLRKVLDEAFLHGGKEYRWLFGPDNNYDWYRPGDAALVEVLYALVPVPLGRLDADVLGSLYESYADEIDRDRRGQFFTPRSVVRFMLDRVGFDGPDGVFRVEGDQRKPLQVLDFATGSGGFLVEAARRVISVAAADPNDERALREGLNAIVRGFVGSEISPFPYYLTEINLLLQVSRLLGALRHATGKREAALPALGVLHVDTLAAKRKSNLQSFEGLGSEHRKDEGELPEDERFDLVPLDGEKRDTWRDRLWQDGVFDFVVGNPPYVSEANNKVLFDLLRKINAWKGIYRGKTDYLYYFLLLALDKLKPGGKLCVIVPAGWMNAGEAGFLRERLARELRIDELFLFGSYRLFATGSDAPPPTVESAILVATKTVAPADHLMRIVAVENDVRRDRDELLAEMVARAVGEPGRKDGIHVHDLPQAALKSDRPWPVKHSATDLGSRVVAHLDAHVEGQKESVVALEADWKVFRGIETGADAYSNRILKRLTPEARARMNALGARRQDPIYELPPGSEARQPWSSHPELLERNPEPSALLYAAIDPADYSNLVRLTSDRPPPVAVLAVIERWKPILGSRAGFVDFPNRPWWETHRARNYSDLRKPKVISLYRTDRGRFSLDEDGRLGPSNKSTVIVGRSDGEAPVAYLCGLLNSELLDLWYAVRGKRPRDVWRNYEPLRMNEMPYRRPAGDPRADKVAGLVRKIAANRLALLPHRDVVVHLGRIVKDPWRTGPVVVDEAKFIANLDASDTVSVRLDPTLTTWFEGHSGRVERLTAEEIVLVNGKTVVGRISGPQARLDLIARLLPKRIGSDAESTILPRDPDGFAHAVSDRVSAVQSLLDEGRRLVEEVERLVCSLYDVPDEMTDEIVGHAVARAAAHAPSQGEPEPEDG